MAHHPSLRDPVHMEQDCAAEPNLGGWTDEPKARCARPTCVPAPIPCRPGTAQGEGPDVVGKRLSAARRIIHQADLDPRVRKRDSSKPAGTVLSQQPKAGRRVNEGRTVLLVVACSGGVGGGGGNCHSSYPDFCIPPPPPDLDCAQVNGTIFTVVGSDPHGFDGDNDGVGCES
jgi:hypothetical protein